MKVGKSNTRGNSIGTSLSNALIMITVTVINVFSKNRTKK